MVLGTTGALALPATAQVLDAWFWFSLYINEMIPLNVKDVLGYLPIQDISSELNLPMEPAFYLALSSHAQTKEDIHYVGLVGASFDISPIHSL